MHGDDFTMLGSRKQLDWLRGRIESKFEIKSEVLGPGPQHSKQIRVLNRVISWTEEGLVYEPDQRHAEIVIRELGLEGGQAVNSPGGREEPNQASSPGDAAAVEVVDESPPMATRDATAYRGITARPNYLAQDRADIQYACKEASRRMACLRRADWLMPKRVARSLLGVAGRAGEGRCLHRLGLGRLQVHLPEH